jgi:osmotically-inducible protein OsmY
MQVRFFFISVILVGAAAWCGGCASVTADKQAQDEPKPAMRALGQPVLPATQSGEEPTNESIGSEIRRLLDTDPASAAGIIVEVDDGKVTLRGKALTLAAAWRAQAVAHSVKGVKSVANQIIVNALSIVP